MALFPVDLFQAELEQYRRVLAEASPELDKSLAKQLVLAADLSLLLRRSSGLPKRRVPVLPAAMCLASLQATTGLPIGDGTP